MKRSHEISTGRVVTVSFLVDLLDVLTNLVVAIFTGSAVIFAEMAQGAADALGSFILIIGHRRSRRPRDELHPMGYAREVFFWALLSSMVMLSLGSGLSFFRGYQQLARLEPLHLPALALAVLILSVATNGYALSQGVRKLQGPEGSLVARFRGSSQQLVKTALLRDVLGTMSALIGLASLTLYLGFGLVIFDALGAMLIGVMMLAFAVILISEARGYITGRSATLATRREILDAVRSVPGVEAVNDLVAVVSGPEEVMVELDLDLADDLTTAQVERVLDSVEASVMRSVPSVRHVSVDLNPAS